MERFRECFYRPMLSSTATFERWLKLGGARLPACLPAPPERAAAADLPSVFALIVIATNTDEGSPDPSGRATRGSGRPERRRGRRRQPGRGYGRLGCRSPRE